MREFPSLIGKRFGKLTVVAQLPSTARGQRRSLCKCDCGGEHIAISGNLNSGRSTNCGCLTRINSAKANAYDLHGKTFGELEVLNIAKDHPKDARGGVWWHCKCSCGNEIDVLATLPATGRKTHCSCKADPQYYSVDITDRQFGRLTAKYPLKDRDRKGGVAWHCKCECGNEVDFLKTVWK